jgi:ankyrin repeat protein
VSTKPIMPQHKLSSICCDRNPVPSVQRKTVIALIHKGSDVNETDKNGVTPLHHAVRFRSPTAVATLLENGANVNQICKRSGSTPLHRAVTSTGAPGTAGRSKEAREIIELLLNFGADPTIKNKNAKLPSDYTKDAKVIAMLAE